MLGVWLWLVWGGADWVWLLSVEDLAVEAVFAFWCGAGGFIGAVVIWWRGPVVGVGCSGDVYELDVFVAYGAVTHAARAVGH